MSDNPLARIHPLAMHRDLWPNEYLCPKQVETFMAVEDSKETYVKAAQAVR